MNIFKYFEALNTVQMCFKVSFDPYVHGLQALDFRALIQYEDVILAV